VGNCFDGQLSMLTDPERLRIESAVGAAAESWPDWTTPAGEAKAHTVRAGAWPASGASRLRNALDQAADRGATCG